MTDWQQPLIVALTQAEGVSIVHETVYENRFGFTEALHRDGRGHRVHQDGLAAPHRRVPRRDLEQAAVITGPTPLHGADIAVPDLRGGFSHLIAALTAEGRSTVQQRRASSAAATRTSIEQARGARGATSRSKAEPAAARRPTRSRPSLWRRRPSGAICGAWSSVVQLLAPSRSGTPRSSRRPGRSS